MQCVVERNALLGEQLRRDLGDELPGFGPLTAAKLVGEIAGAHRFATDAKLARAAGVATIPSAPARPTATASAAAATAKSTRPSTASPSPPALPRRDPALHRPQTRRRQEHQRSHPLPQTTLARRLWHLLQPPQPTDTIKLLT
jgi:hypothetical protein